MKAGFAQNARELSIHILLEIIKEDGFANIAIDSFLQESQLAKVERAFATQLVYGVMRHYNTLEWILEQFVGQKIKKLKPIIKVILLIGIYQLIYLDKVPNSAACNEAGKLARKYGHKGIVAFVNGVLRNIARQKEELNFPSVDKNPIAHIALKYSHPEWLIERWLKRYGFNETVELCKKNNEPASIWLRCNTLKLSAAELQQQLAAAGITAKQSNFAPEGVVISNFDSITKLPGYDLGHFQVQDESSIVVGHVVNPEAGAKIIDACSAPGGKTTHLAQLMRNDGVIKAFDIYDHKLKLIKTNCARLGIQIVEVQLKDATALHEEFADWADFVLADVPCSGIGVLRRRADARWRKKPEQLIALPKLQLSILASASKCVKKNGILVYSTCSIEPEENIEVINKFLAANDNFLPADMQQLLPFKLTENEQVAAKNGYFQFLPHIHGTDGFFVSRMKRIK